MIHEQEFEIIRGVENEIEFKGLRGKYVWWLWIGLGADFLLGIILLLLLPSPTLVALITIGGAGVIFHVTFDWNKKYGRWGYERMLIQKNLPRYIVMRRPHSLIRKKNG